MQLHVEFRSSIESFIVPILSAASSDFTKVSLSSCRVIINDNFTIFNGRIVVMPLPWIYKFVR